MMISLSFCNIRGKKSLHFSDLSWSSSLNTFLMNLKIAEVCSQRRPDWWTLLRSTGLSQSTILTWIMRTSKVREQFTKCLEANCHAFDDMRVLRIRDYWDRNDDNLVYNNQMSKVGVFTYWKVMDASFQYNIKKRNEFLIRSKFRSLKASWYRRYQVWAVKEGCSRRFRRFRRQ